MIRTGETAKSRVSAQRVNIRSVALPAEHGGWGFLLEPILLGLLVAPSWTGVLFCAAMTAVFLIHQPVKIVVKDRRKGKRSARTLLAERFALAYGAAAVILLLPIIPNAPRDMLLPVMVALPLMVTQLFFDAGNRSRELLPEMTGSSALGAIAACVALLDGWTLSAALILWVILVARNVPSILYVRARLRLERDKPISPLPAWGSHMIAFAGIAILAAMDEAPVLAAVAMAILLARALHGLSHYRKPASRPAIIGIQEVIFGLVSVLLVAVGY